MAIRQGPGILVGEMVADAYTEQHSFICCTRGQRRAIERLGTGWLLLFPFPTYLSTNATLPSSPSNRISGSALRTAVSREATSDARALGQTKKPHREVGDA